MRKQTDRATRRFNDFNLNARRSKRQAGGGGCPSKLGRLSSTQAHDGALAVQIVAAGLAISGSSSVPARTKIRCGRASASLNRCVPHAGQKRRCILFPLSAVLWKSEVVPVIDIPAVGKQTLTAALPVAMYWQSRHQHSRVMIGSASVR